MAERVTYVPRPYVRTPHVADTRTLGDLMRRQADVGAQGALLRGQSAGDMWRTIAQAFGGYQQIEREKEQIAAAQAIREQERQAAEALKREEMAARAAEREEAARIRQEAATRQTRMDTEKLADTRARAIGYGPLAESDVDLVMQSPERGGDVRYAFGPGTADGPELRPTREQARGIEIERAIQGMGGTVGPNGQVVMPPKPDVPTGRINVQPVMVNGRRVFAQVHPDGRITDMRGQPMEAQPIPPQGPTGGEPLEAVIGPDGNPMLVPRGQARGMRPATTREQPTEDERKSAGFYKQMQEAIAIMDETEGQLTETDLYQIQTLPQEALIGAANRGKMSEAAKRYLRAFEQFTEARMRPVSGAAISDSEFARDRRTYARQYAETPALAKDRKAARSSAAESLRARASRALPKTEAPKNVDPLGIRK